MEHNPVASGRVKNWTEFEPWTGLQVELGNWSVLYLSRKYQRYLKCSICLSLVR